jgi:hypothetical protein
MRKFGIVSMALCLVGFFALVLGGGYAFGEYHHEEWDAAKRHKLYMTPIGVWFMPYDWFVNLETKDSQAPIWTSPDGKQKRYEMFAEKLEKYGVIFLDTTDGLDKLALGDAVHNPDGKLPVGYLKSENAPPFKDNYGKHINGLLGKDRPWLGQSCAGCHTGSLTYNGKRHRIDGGPAMVDIFNLAGDLYTSLQDTLVHKDKLGRFLGRLGINITDPAQRQKAMREVGAMGILLRRTNTNNPILEFPRIINLYAPPPDPRVAGWGFGRGDAYARGGNTALGALVPPDDMDAMTIDAAGGALVPSQSCASYDDPKYAAHADAKLKEKCVAFGNPNRIEATSPVSNPHFWNSWRYNRVEWNGSVQHPLGRNIGQAITTGRRLWFHTSGDPFDSDVDINSLWDLETTVFRHIPAPHWPAEFPRIDELSAQLGKRIYIDKCKACHIPKPLSKDNELRAKLHIEYDMKDSLIPVDDIKTHRGMTENFADRKAVTGALEQTMKKPVADAYEIMQLMTTEMMKRANIPGSHPDLNQWFSEKVYLARPNPGIWATPPFLHNGSVPSLATLLLPADQRPKVFCIGTFEFDPDEVGYRYAPLQGPSCPPGQQLLYTAAPGNSNSGHEYKGKPGDGSDCEHIQRGKAKDGVLGCELTPTDRKALVEYLKTCDLDLPDTLEADDKKSMAQDWEGLPPRITIAGNCEKRTRWLISVKQTGS